MAQIRSIYIAPEKNADQISVEHVEVVNNKGIVGDRNYGRKKYKGQNITLVELEVIQEFCQEYDIQFQLDITRRNIVTEGIRLNNLVGKNFRIGEVEIFGEKLCEPCKSLGRRLATEQLSSREVIQFFRGRGGLRGTIITSGVINKGMNICLLG